jgi:hypothetical protein
MTFSVFRLRFPFHEHRRRFAPPDADRRDSALFPLVAERVHECRQDASA